MNRHFLVSALGILLLCVLPAAAQNPFVQTWYTSDPAPLVLGDSMYVCAHSRRSNGMAIGYALSDSPTGPWEPKGYIKRLTERDRGNHPGICEYKDHTYCFGQNYDLMHLEAFEHHERRSVSATEITYHADETIREVSYWMDQQPLQQLQWLNLYLCFDHVQGDVRLD